MPHPLAPRLVCVDVDGTLVGASGAVHPAVWPAAERLRALGVRLAVCSGRPGFGDARRHAERLDGDGWHVFQNGASVVHAGSGASRSTPLPAAALAALVDRAAATGWALELYRDADYVIVPGAVDPDETRAHRHAALLGVPLSVATLAEAAALDGVVRAQWMVDHAALPAVLAAAVPGTRLLPSLSPVMPETTFVSVLAPGVDKAAAVRQVAAAYALPLSAVTFVGDGGNDAAAMAAVRAGGGHAVAMGNAEPAALAAAEHVVGDVEAGGLVEAFALVEALGRRAA